MMVMMKLMRVAPILITNGPIDDDGVEGDENIHFEILSNAAMRCSGKGC